MAKWVSWVTDVQSLTLTHRPRKSLKNVLYDTRWAGSDGTQTCVGICALYNSINAFITNIILLSD